jgi:hypothetical protein
VLGFSLDDRHGPLPLGLLVLTGVTGLVDAASYLKLGQVFVANMTGNVVFLGFAVVDADDFSIPAPLVAIAGFLGAAVGALLVFHTGVIAVLALALSLLVLNGIGSYRLRSSPEAWTLRREFVARVQP